MHVPLDLTDGPGLRLVRVLPELAAGPALPEQVPALVEGFLGGLQLLALRRGAELTCGKLPAEGVLGLDEIVEVSQDLLVVHAPTVSPRTGLGGTGANY